jgi:predicted dehydrogenase
MSEKLRVGIVGCGIGFQHAAGFCNLPDWFEVSAVCDLDIDRARSMADDFGIARAVTDIDEMYRMDDLEVIDLCTPSYLHHRQTLEALSAGKHVICEKPVAGSLAQVDELLAAEAASGRRVMPIFQYRFGGGLQKLKHLHAAGLTGRALLTTAETAWRRRAEYYAVPWRGKWQTEMGGALLTLAIHAHDAVLYVLGPASSVSAQTATLVNPIETEDTVTASVRMADGSLCSLSVTTGSALEISRHRFCFQNLAAESNTLPYNNTSDEWTFTGDTPETTAAVEAALAQFEALPEGMEGQFYRYYLALQNGTELPVTLMDARNSLELITAIYAASRTGAEVRLPMLKDHPLYSGWQPQN